MFNTFTKLLISKLLQHWKETEMTAFGSNGNQNSPTASGPQPTPFQKDGESNFRQGRRTASTGDIVREEDQDSDIFGGNNVEQGHLDFEFVVLEVALEVICAQYERSALSLRMDLLPALDNLSERVNSNNLDLVKKLKNRY